MQEPIWTVLINFVVQIKHIHEYFFKSIAWDSEYRKKVEQNYVYSSAFVFVFLWAEDVGSAELHTEFLTPDISFNTDLKLMSPGTKTLQYSVENLKSKLDSLNQYHHVHFGRIFRKKIMWKSVNFTKKVIFILYKKTKSLMMGLLTFFHVRQSNFENIVWFLSNTHKFMKIAIKTNLTRKVIISKSTNVSSSKLDTTFLKLAPTLCQNFNFVYFELIWK